MVKKILIDWGFVAYYFLLFILACMMLAVVEIINLAGLLRRKKKIAPIHKYLCPLCKKEVEIGGHKPCLTTKETKND